MTPTTVTAPRHQSQACYASLPPPTTMATHLARVTAPPMVRPEALGSTSVSSGTAVGLMRQAIRQANMRRDKGELVGLMSDKAGQQQGDRERVGDRGAAVNKVSE